MRVLYIEDEKFLADAVKYNLEKAGLTCDVRRDGNSGLNAAVKNIYDCIILDLMLPEISGEGIIKILRAKPIHTPIIVLSALSETEDKIHHLNIGADDYLAKPFKTAELLARIRALQRRPRQVQSVHVKFADLDYDSANKSLNNISLTPKEASILEELLKTPKKTVSKEYLATKIWQSAIANNYVEVYISRLRSKLKQLGSNVTIRSHRGFGYKLCS